MAIIMGTETYGKQTDSSVSTYHELHYINDDKKPFFLIKMCSQFLEPYTRMVLHKDVSHFPWTPGQPIPPDLKERILSKYRGLVR